MTTSFYNVLNVIDRILQWYCINILTVVLCGQTPCKNLLTNYWDNLANLLFCTEHSVVRSELPTWVLHSQCNHMVHKFSIQLFSKTYEPLVKKVQSSLRMPCTLSQSNFWWKELKIFPNQPLEQSRLWGENCRAITHRKVDSGSCSAVLGVIFKL